MNELVDQSHIVSEKAATDTLGDIYNILHTNAKVFKVTNGVSNAFMFEFASEQIAKRRKLMLALKTYNFRLHFYFKCLTNMNEESILDTYERTILKVLKLDVKKDQKWVSNKSQTIKQQYVPEANGVFLGAVPPNPMAPMNCKTTHLKFILGRKVYEDKSTYFWQKDESEKVNS